jgi:hypothetical protein
MQERIAPFVNTSVVARLIVSFIVCQVLFRLRRRRIGDDIPDLWRHWYTPQKVHQFLDDLKTDSNRNLYALSQVTLDVVFPITYGLLAAVTLYSLLGQSLPALEFLLYLPLITVAADLLENITVAWLAWTFQSCAPPRKLAWLTALGTLVKWWSFYLLLLVLLWLLARICF